MRIIPFHKTLRAAGISPERETRDGTRQIEISWGTPTSSPRTHPSNSSYFCEFYLGDGTRRKTDFHGVAMLKAVTQRNQSRRR